MSNFKIMNLRNIGLFMSFDSGYKDPFRDNFNLGVKFINNYISKNVRPLKIETDGTYNMINIEPSVDNIGKCTPKGEKAINVRVDFDKNLFLSLSEIEKNDYCLELLKTGYDFLSVYKKIDINQLLAISNQLKNENFVNEWIYKKKKFKDQDLEVKLICKFSRSDFRLLLIVINSKSKDELFNDILIKTLPDEVCFAPLFKDIVISDDKLIITEFQDRPKFIFNLEDVYKKRFVFTVTDVGLIYKELE